MDKIKVRIEDGEGNIQIYSMSATAFKAIDWLQKTYGGFTLGFDDLKIQKLGKDDKVSDLNF